MKYFNGFSLINEKELFNEYLNKSEFSVIGFSYGAIKAFEYTLNSNERIDKLILISPAFFQNQNEKFKRLQLINFKKNPNLYIDNFLKNITYPSNINLNKYLNKGTFEELEELLNYEWSIEKLDNLIKKNIKIEIYLGESDKIIDSNLAKIFFIDFATIYFIKSVGHILKD